jgi:hypothetical protein
METIFGIVESGRDYRELLVANGYVNMGWQNGWDTKSLDLWKHMQNNADSIEDIRWNRSGSDVTYVSHDYKVFCSVDMGD